MSEQWNVVNLNDVHKLSKEVNMYRQGTLSDGDFLPQRLANGIYGQRQDDAYMVRIKLPGGQLSVAQLERIGNLIDEYSEIDFASVTTRQDIQLHFVSLENVTYVLSQLGEVGLTTREACGNTVRNVTACSLAGQCEKEHVDIRPILDESVLHFMRHPLTQYMPRKVKMSFSGCEVDCAMGMINDVGVVAINDNGNLGFKVLVGGGLGHKPRQSIVIEEFVNRENLPLVIETIITMHNRFSDRKKRAKSRIKFLIDKFGEDGFRENYQMVLEEVSRKMKITSKASESLVHIDNHAPISFSYNDFQPIEIDLPIGDINHEKIKKLSIVMAEFGLKKLQATHTQNLILVDVKKTLVDDVRKALSGIGMQSNNFSLNRKNNVVACPGEWTCRLGITSSRRLAKKLNDDGVDINVNISGCHNGCAQPQLADIGLHGEARRMFGKLIPYYRMYFGGNGKQGGNFGLKGPEVPASRVEFAIRVVEQAYLSDNDGAESFHQWASGRSIEFFNDLLEDIIHVNEGDVSLLLKDVDSVNEFKVLQLGGGECAGISEETVASQLAEATYEKQYRDIFIRQSQFESAVDSAENMLRLVGKSILFQYGGVSGDTLDSVADKLSDTLLKYPEVPRSFKNLVEELESVRGLDNADIFSTFSKSLDKWIENIVTEDNKISIDAFFVANSVAEAIDDAVERESVVLDTVLDLSKEVCPMHYIKARQALRSVNVGQVLKIAIRAGEDQRLVTESLTSVGFNILQTGEYSAESVLLYVEKPEVLNVEVGSKASTEVNIKEDTERSRAVTDAEIA